VLARAWMERTGATAMTHSRTRLSTTSHSRGEHPDAVLRGASAAMSCGAPIRRPSASPPRNPTPSLSGRAP
jgi:hypothetical protein